MKKLHLLLALSLCSCSTPLRDEAQTGATDDPTQALQGGRAEPLSEGWTNLDDPKEQSLRKMTLYPRVGYRGMIVSDDEMASKWGAEILRRGGNAMDAAVATAFALAVTRPHYAALGGGGFIVYCPAPKNGASQPCKTLDYRERAPGKAHRNLYIKDGKARTDLSQDTALGSGVPGTVAGLLKAQETWGRLSRQKVLTRPILLAKKGFPVSGNLEKNAQVRWEVFNDEAKRIFGCGQTQACRAGQTLKQPDLAKVLETISVQGRDGFYKGWVAHKIVKSMSKAGGIIGLDDLSQYEPKFRKPVQGNVGPYQIVSMGPPSSGGGIVIQLLKYMQEASRLEQLPKGYPSAPLIHAMGHAMSLSFADRAQYFGDPDYAKVPMDGLIKDSYIRERWAQTFQEDSRNLPEGHGTPSKESADTTHFSVIDKAGNAVALTTTVNWGFGNGFVPHGTGVVMNNEMDDFSVSPGVPNGFGLLGNEANSVQAGKRPLSSMSPTIVRDRKGNSRIALGAAGGPRIITAVFQVLLARLRYGLSLADSVGAPRIHHQWKPEKICIERNMVGQETRDAIEDMGWGEPCKTRGIGRIHALERFPNGRVLGLPDPRAEGYAAAE